MWMSPLSDSANRLRVSLYERNARTGGRTGEAGRDSEQSHRQVGGVALADARKRLAVRQRLHQDGLVARGVEEPFVDQVLLVVVEVALIVEQVQRICEHVLSREKCQRKVWPVETSPRTSRALPLR